MLAESRLCGWALAGCVQSRVGLAGAPRNDLVVAREQCNHTAVGITHDVERGSIGFELRIDLARQVAGKESIGLAIDSARDALTISVELHLLASSIRQLNDAQVIVQTPGELETAMIVRRPPERIPGRVTADVPPVTLSSLLPRS